MRLWLPSRGKFCGWMRRIAQQLLILTVIMPIRAQAEIMMVFLGLLPSGWISDTHNVTIRTDDGNGGLFDRLFTIDVERPLSGVNILPENPDISNNNRSDANSNKANNGVGQLISSFVGGSRSGQLQAFYGESSLDQIILENVTMTLQSSIADINIGSNNIINTPVIIEANLEILNINKDAQTTNNYTRMVDFLKITSEFSEDDSDENTQDLLGDFIDNIINNQFETIQNYNEQRIARLMDALSTR